ncbi:pyruvate kinase [bacterium]|nr:pyruvate kinase [bacterium]
MRKTRILATLGPATESRESLLALREAGVNLFRINASHISPREIREIMERVRDDCPDMPTLLDLAGPKIRLGSVSMERDLVVGRRFRWEPSEGDTDDETIRFGPPSLAESLKDGGVVGVVDGRTTFRLHCKEDIYLVAERVAAPLRKGAGISLPEGALGEGSLLSQADKRALAVGISENVTVVAASYVRGPKDVLEVRDAMGKGSKTLLMSKIERPEVLPVLDETLALSDLVMVARGDLGASVGLEEVPRLQKRIVKLARERVVGVAVATEMLESMVHSPVPTRAEAMDIDGAVEQGADILTLSAETAMGDNPVQAVKWMARIIESSEAERGFDPVRSGTGTAERIGVAAVDLAAAAGAKAFVVLTRSGFSARNLARHRPSIPILAVVTDEMAAKRASFLRGVFPVVSTVKGVEARFLWGVRTLLARGWVASGEKVVGALALPHEDPGGTSGLFLLRAP